MTTYNLIEKNGNAVITLGADTVREVTNWEKERGLNFDEWRLEELGV